jgi:hypothetical protein
MQAYRHLHLPGKIGIHDCQAALRLERSAAIGHPIQQWCQGEYPGKVFVLDVNSLFPWIMGNYPFPRKLLWYSENTTIANLQRSCETSLAIARVSGRDYSQSYLVKREDGCIFTSILDNDVLCGPDLDRALQRSIITHVSEAAAYEGAGNFVQWSDWAWALRRHYQEEGSVLELRLAKALTTRLWTQFSMRLERWVDFPNPPKDIKPYDDFFYKQVGQETKRCRSIAGVVEMLEIGEESDNSFPAISAFVACYARNVMRLLTLVAKEENVIYHCADALHVNQAGFNNLADGGFIRPDSYGALKLVEAAENAIYCNRNCYVHDGKIKQAGRPVDAAGNAQTGWSWQSAPRLSSSIFEPPSATVHFDRHYVGPPTEMARK